MTVDRFESTSWSVVLAARNERTVISRKALASLCETYWPPLYGYIRGRGYTTEEAVRAWDKAKAEERR